MKTLRYLLIAVMMLSVLSLGAQNIAQQPSSDFRSTSVMMGTGSTLPQAAQTGTVTTYDVPSGPRNGHIRRGASGEDGGDTPPADPHGPNEDPIGDATWPLLMLALAYVFARAFHKRRA